MATFTRSQMEAAWQALFALVDDKQWVDIVSSTTGEFYRLTVAGGVLRHWNRTTGSWDTLGAVPASLIAVTVNE